MYGIATGELIKLLLAFGVALLALAFWLVCRKKPGSGRDRPRKVLRAILGFVVVLAAGNYYRFSPDLLLSKVNGYDMFHYYLGSKYFDELGYYNAYPAILLADAEDERFFQKIGIRRFRDHASQRVVPVDAVLDRAVEVRGRFSTARWAELKRDLRHFIRITPAREWPVLLEDRGYNATPFARWVGSLLSTRVSVEQLKLIGLIDVVLLTIALAFVGKAYGIDTVLFALAFLFTTFSGRWPPFGEAMLRMDWVSAMIISVCLLRMRLPTAAGVMWGYATSIRIFPGVFLFGVAVRIIVNVVRRSPIPAGDVKLLAAAMLSFAALNEVVLLRDGFQPFLSSTRKLMAHQKSTNLSSQRVGLGVALAYRGELYKDDSHSGRRWTAKKRLAETMKPYRYGVAAAALFVLGAIVLRRDGDETLILGMAAFFFISIASYYYYIMRVLLVMNHAADLRRTSNGVGLAFLLLIEAFSQAHQLASTSRYAATAQLSILLTAYFVTVLGIGLFEVYGAKRDAGTSDDAAA